MGWGRPSICGGCGTCQRCRHAAYMREWYARYTPEERRAMRQTRNLEQVRKRDLERHRRMSGQPEYERRRAAVSAVNSAIKQGRLKRQPCEVCGAWAQAHHEDYDAPLSVQWLCPQHHADHHARRAA